MGGVARIARMRQKMRQTVQFFPSAQVRRQSPVALTKGHAEPAD